MYGLPRRPRANTVSSDQFSRIVESSGLRPQVSELTLSCVRSHPSIKSSRPKSPVALLKLFRDVLLALPCNWLNVAENKVNLKAEQFELSDCFLEAWWLLRLMH